jgi:hypothetical protein
MDMTSRQGGGGMFVLLDCSVTGSDFRGVAVKKAKGAGHFVGIDRQNELVTVAGKKIVGEKSYRVLVIRFSTNL